MKIQYVENSNYMNRYGSNSTRYQSKVAREEMLRNFRAYF